MMVMTYLLTYLYIIINQANIYYYIYLFTQDTSLFIMLEESIQKRKSDYLEERKTVDQQTTTTTTKTFLKRNIPLYYFLSMNVRHRQQSVRYAERQTNTQ